jgi:GT2 family glycosyltransferase
MDATVASLAVIVINWNTRELLSECLTSIAASAGERDVDVVVVDNGSSDGSAAMVRERFPAVRLIANAENRGFARANNQAIAATDAPYVLMLNSDAQLSGHALETLLARLVATPRAGLVGAQLRSPNGRFQCSHARFPSFRQEALILSGLGRALRGPWYPSAGPDGDANARIVDWVGGACMLARRAALDAVGGFDECYPLYGEETDLCYALRQAGWEVWYEPAAVVVHLGGASTALIVEPREARLYRGRMRFFRKHYGERAARLFALELCAFMVPKIAGHRTLRALSGGRLGRRTLSLRALRAALDERDDLAAVAPVRASPRARGIRPARDDGRQLVLATTALSAAQGEDAAHREHARVDYVELQRLVGAEVLDYGSYPRGRTGAAIRWLETQLRSDPYLAIRALPRLRHDRPVVCLSERVGVPLAALRRARVHDARLRVLFQGWSERQEAVITRLNLFAQMERIAVLSRAQRDHFIALGAAPERVHVVRWSPDHRFFTPMEASPAADVPIALTLGERRHRDYSWLFAAIAGLRVELRVLAYGYSGAREKHGTALESPPPNTTVLPRAPAARLRELYAEAQFVVLPVYDLLYPAGVTAALEAMCMGRAVIATRSRGLADYLRDGETCLLVDPGDVAALRHAVERLAGDPALARRLGANGRRMIDAELNLPRYVRDLAAALAEEPAEGGEAHS